MNSVNVSQPIVARAYHKISSGQGVNLAVQEWGNPQGKPILFSHAFAMSHLDYLPQVTSALAQDFRLITFDHRGHGESDKPADPAAYDNAQGFAEDFHAIITTLNLQKPIIVAHSMSGVLVGDYLNQYGDGQVGGVVLLAANTKLGSAMFQTQIGAAFVDPRSQGVFSDSLLERINAWNFVNRYLSTASPSDEIHDIFLASSMVASQVFFNPVLTREQNYLPLYQALRVPILVIHAQDDAIVLPAAAEQLLAVRPDAQCVLYNSGAHAPHWENAAQFNPALATFVNTIL
jgi:non-heme chloroperoxidase